MITTYSYINTQPTFKSLSSEKGFRPKERDLDILEFTLEMKFSTLEDLHSKFFKVTKDGAISNSVIWAKQRIQRLVRSEYLQILPDVCSKPLYVLTQKGFLFLKNSRIFKNYCRPLFEVDGRFYDHDQKVASFRIKLEKLGIVQEWISERQLSEIDEVKKYLPTEFRPDGIYINAEGKKVAFELEIARKTKERYQQKVNRYIQVMTSTHDHERIFDEVHYICEKETVRNLIQDQAVLFQPLFKLNLFSDFSN